MTPVQAVEADLLRARAQLEKGEHQAASGLQSLLGEGREEQGVADEGEQEMRLHVVGRVGERVFQVDGLLIEHGGR